MCGASHFFTPFAGPTKGWIFVFLPWGGPRVGNPPLVAACVSISAEACCCCCCWSLSSSSSSKETSKLLASEPYSESLSATRISLMTCSSVLFFPVIETDTYNCLPCLHASVRLAQLWNVMQLRYERLIQWEQNRSKVTMWQLYEFQELGGAKSF